MKRQMNITAKSIIILSVIIFITGILLTYGTVLLVDYSKNANDTASAVIGLIGNISGGLIGGIAAYLVAAFQIKSTIDHDGHKSVSASYSILRLVRSELVNNKNIILKYKTDFANGQQFSNLHSISSTYWDRSLDKLGSEVKDQTIAKAQRCYSMIEAYKRQNNNINEAASDNLVTAIEEAVNLIEQDINEMRRIH